MSYVNKKIRVFKEAGDIEIHRKRSDGRMKTYTSATDARAWCDSTEDRRQHILDLVRQGDGKGLSLGKYIPIEAIIDILLANKNNDIKRLLREIEELKKFIKDHGLHYEEKPIRVIEPVGSTAGEGTSGVGGARPGQEATAGRGKSPAGRAGEDRAGVTTGQPGTGGISDTEGRGGVSDSTGRGGVSDSIGRGGVSDSTGRGGVSGSAGRGGVPGLSDARGRGEIFDTEGREKGAAETAGTDGKATRYGGQKTELSDLDEYETGTTSGTDRSKRSTSPQGQAGSKDAPTGQYQGSRTTPEDSTTTGGTSTPGFITDSSDYEDRASPRFRPVSKEDEKAAAALLAGKSPEDQLLALKSALADAENYYSDQNGIAHEAIEKLENIKDIVDGGEGKLSPKRPSPAHSPKKQSFAVGKSPDKTFDERRTSPSYAAKDLSSGGGKAAGKAYDEERSKGLPSAGSPAAEKVYEEQRMSSSYAPAAAGARSYDAERSRAQTDSSVTGEKVGPRAYDDERSKAPSGGKPTARGYDGVADSCKGEIEALEREIATMKSMSSPESNIIKREVEVLKKYCAQLAAIQQENADLKRERDILKDGLTSGADNAIKDKLKKLDDVTQERDRLKARVKQLEQQLGGYSGLPEEVDQFREKEPALDSLREDVSDLRRRLDKMEGLEDDVRSLRDKAATTVQPAGDSTEKDKLLARIAELEKENDNCKCKMREIEICKVERNCLKMRLEDLMRIQKDYEDLLKKTQGFDALKAECAMYKAKYEELKNMEAECNELRAKCQRVEELENERRLLMKEIENCECCMNNQEDEIKRLACHIDCLTQDLDKRQDEMKVKVLTMRAHLEKKDCLIAKSEQQLADVQDQLRTSIENLSCETTCLRNRIDELEDEVKAKDNVYRTLESKYKELEDTNTSLKQNLENEKNVKLKLEEALRKAIRSDEHLKQMLKQAKCAIKCITQKLEKHDIVGMGRLELERENYLRKIKELEEGMTEQPCGADRIAELEEELMRSHALNKCLRDTLEQLKLSDKSGEQPCGAERIAELEEEIMKLSAENKKLKHSLEQVKGAAQENEALRKIAGELQDTAKSQVNKLEDTLSKKSHELEDQCEELRASLAEKEKLIQNLTKQLELERKRREEAEKALETLSANGEVDQVELNKLKAQMNVLNAEIDRLNFDLENQKRECEETVNRLKAKMEQIENDNLRFKKLEEAHGDVSTDADRYRKEAQLIREELDKCRKENESLKAELDKCKKDGDSLKSELEKIKKQNDDLHFEMERVTKENEFLKSGLEMSKDKKIKSESEIGKLKDELAVKAALENENKSLKDETNRLKQELAAKSGLEQENKSLKEDLNKLKQELASKDALDKENKSLKDELNKLKQDLASKDALDKENKSLKDELNKLKQELAAAKQDTSKGATENENKSLKDENNSLKDDIKGLKFENQSLKDENKSLKDELNKLKQELANRAGVVKDDSKDKEFAKERDDLLKQIAAQKKEIADLLDKIKQPAKSEDTTTLKELENRNKENQKLRSTIEDLEKQLKELQKAKMDVPKASPEIDKVLNDLKQSLEKEEARVRDLEAKLKKCQGDNDGFKKKNNELENSLKKCQDGNEELKKRIAELEAQGDSLRKKAIEQEIAQIPVGEDGDRVKALEAELAKRKKECDDMIASLKEQYDRDIKNLQKQNETAIDKLQKQHQEELKKLNDEREKEAAKFKQELKEINKVKRSPSVEKKQKPQPQPKKEAPPPIEEARDEEEKPPSVKEPVKETSIKEPSIKEPSIKEPSIKEPSIKEEQEDKKKKLSMKTFDDVCICGKLPMVIPIGAVAAPQAPPCPCPPPQPCVPYPPSYQMVPQQMPPCMPPSPPCMQMPLPMHQPLVPCSHKDEKVNTIKKIVEMENRLLLKQQHTKEKIDSLQSTVNKFKRELELERQKNSDLVSRYTNQSKTVANMKVEMDLVRKENFQDKRRLEQLNITLKNILEKGSGTMCLCPKTAVRSGIPHFHTELSVVKADDNKYKHNCVLKKGPCSCGVGDKSSDSFDIGPRSSSEPSLARRINNENLLQAIPLKISNLDIPTNFIAGPDQKTKIADEMKKLEIVTKKLADVQSYDSQNLKSRVSDLETNLAQTEETIEILREKLDLEMKDKQILKDSIVKITKNCVCALKNKIMDEATSDLATKLEEKERQIHELQEERSILSKEVQDCENYITNHVDQMKKLASYIDQLTQNSEKLHVERKSKTSTVTNQSGENDGTCNCDSKRIKELEAKVNRYKVRLNAKDENIKALQEKLEFERISREKLEEAFLRTAKIYEDLVYQNQGLGNMKYEYEACKAQCEQFRITCDDLRFKARKVEELEREINHCNCYMVNQDNRVSQLLDDMEVMSQRENRMKITILNMETSLEEYSEKLDKCQNEKSSLRDRIEALETQIEDYDNIVALKEENNKILSENLEKEKAAKAKLETSIVTIVKTDEHLKEMLTQARQAMTTITQRLEECDIERLETQRDNQMKICELENQLILANATIKKLKENLDQMKGVMDKNVALRSLSAQLHESANIQVAQLKAANEDLSKRSQKMVEMYDYLKQVLYEKDKTFEDLRNHLVSLRQRLDNEQKLREDTENILADMAATGDSELSELRNVISMLKNEICCLHCELEDLMNTTTAGRLKTRVKDLEVEIEVLKCERNKYRKYLDKILPGYVDPVELERLHNELNQMTEEITRLNEELGRQKKLRLDTVMGLQLKIEKQEKENKMIKEQIRESIEQKKRRDPTLPNVVFVEKKDKQDGGVEYRYLYGVAEGKRKSLQPPQEDYYKYECYTQENGIEKKVFLGPLHLTYIDDNGEIKHFPIDPKTATPKKEFYIKERGQNKKILWNLKTGPFKLNIEEEFNFRKKYEDAVREINRLQSKLEMVKYETNGPEQKLMEDVKDIKDIDSKLTSAISEAVTLQKQLDMPTNVKNHEPFSQEREALTREIEKQKKEITELLRKIQESSVGHEVLKELESKKLENERLKTRVRDLERQLQNAQFEVDIPRSSPQADTLVENLKHHLEREQKRVNELEDLLRICQNNDKELKQENVKLKSEILRDKTLPRASQLYVNQLQQVDDNLKDWQNQINNNVSHVQQQVNNIIDKLERTPGNADNVKKLLDGVKNFEANLDSVVNKKRVSLTNDLQEKHITELEKQLSEMRQTLHTLEEEKENFKNIGSTKQLEEQLKDYQRKNADLNMELERLRQALKESRKSFESDIRLKRFSDISVNDKSPRVKELEETLHQWQRDYDLEVGKLKKEIEKLMVRGNLPQGCEAHENLIKELKNDLEKSHRKNENNERKIAQLEGENENLLTMMDKFNDVGSIDDSAEDDKKVRDLVEHLRELQRKNEALKTRTIQLEMENGRMKNDLDRIVGQGNKSYEKEMQRLRDLERQSARSQDKYHNLKKRLMKLEIENKNLKKEYIDTLIAKEKLSLKSREQEQRLRETNKLLGKCQDKKQTLTMRMLKTQDDHDNLKKQLEVDSQAIEEENCMKIQIINKELIIKNAQLEEENNYLKKMIPEEERVKVAQIESAMVNVEEELNKYVDQGARIAHLEMENALLKKELDGIRSKDISSIDIESKRSSENLQIRAVELEIENEFLRGELTDKEKYSYEFGMNEKRVNELEEEVQKLTEANEKLQMKNVDLELDHQYMKDEMDRITKVRQKLESEIPNKDVEKQNHALKLKNDHLELEIKKLKVQLENMGKEQISLQSHVQENRLKKMEALINEYESLREAAPKSTGVLGRTTKENLDELEEVEEKMQEWQGQFQPQLLDMKKDLEKLMGKSKSGTNFRHLEDQLREAKTKISHLETENRNLKAEVEIMRKGLPADEAKLARDVEQILKNLPKQESPPKNVDEKKFKDLEARLRECQQMNEFLRNEKVALDKHVQSKRIQDLESQVRESRFRDASKTDLRLRGQKSIMLDVQEMKSKELEDELGACQSKNEALKTELETLRRGVVTNSDASTKLQECQKQNLLLKEELERLRKITDLHQKLSKDLDKQLRECKKNLEESKKHDKLSKDRKVSFHNIPIDLNDFTNEELAAEIERLRNECEQQRRMISELEESLKKCREINRDFKQENDQLKIEQQFMRQEYGTQFEDRLKQLRDKQKKQQSKGTSDNVSSSRATDDISSLQAKLELSEKDNKKLKDEVNTLTKERNNLLKENEKKEEEIRELQKKVQFLGGGEYEATLKELEYKNQENEKLNLVVSDLEKKIEDLTKLQLEVGKGDTDDKRSRKLEETLQKYHDNNENLKTRIVHLEEEKTNLKKELSAHIEKGKKMPGSEIQARQIRKLEQTLQKYHDNNENLKRKIAFLEADYQEKRVVELEEQVQKCQINNDGLKLVTVQLESEIKYLKEELGSFLRKEEKVAEKLARKRQSKDQKSVESEKDRDLRKKPKQSLFMPQPMTVGPQPPVFAMPIFIQPPFLSYGNYPPQVTNIGNTDNDIEQLSHLVKRIQSSLDQRKKRIQSEKSLVSDQSDKNTSEDDEEVERTLDFESNQSQTLSTTSPVVKITKSSSLTIEKLSKQLLLQQQTKEKMNKLQESIKKTLKEFEQEFGDESPVDQKVNINDASSAVGPSTESTVDKKVFQKHSTSRHEIESASSDSFEKKND
ncbi:centromere protein F-like [Tribolium madens]|uniref:centromere protein F-like n=1 Tax=Tribolium madens TaxID=41895 RepID=UPI001CF72EC1|nr:centromere protein F-like [Tribolium madens]